MSSSLRFRKAGKADSDLLLSWRNDPLTRENAVHTNEVDRESHTCWLSASLENPDRALWMAEKDGAPVGTVRFDRRDHERWELSWTIAPEHRGKGLGKEVVKGATQLMSSDLIARIKACNSSSISIARHAGFEPLPNPDGDPLTWWILRR